MICQDKAMWAQIMEKGVAAMADSLTTEETIELTNRFGTHNYKPLPINIVRGEGAHVWDDKGREFIDGIGAYSAVSHGHLSPMVVKTAKAQLDRVAVTSRAYYNAEVALFLQALANYCELDMVCPMNSGAEAIETCIKLARKWGYTIKGIPEDKAEIIAFSDNFHGRTITIVGFSSEPGYKTNFGPFTPGFKVIPYGDIDALKAAITPNTCAVLMEPIQAEGGILIPPVGYLAATRKLCTEQNVLFCLDEIQTGFCRTGRKFAWMWEDAKPDLMAVGKPLGGGILPVSAAVGTKEVMETFKPGDHGSTFGGNPLGAAVAVAALAELEVNHMAEKAEKLGNEAVARLKGYNHPHVKEIRARGLLIGIEVDETVDTKALTEALITNGILTKETRKRTFRLTPPLSISEADLMEAIDRVHRSLSAIGA